jgi:hypothetical protein
MAKRWSSGLANGTHRFGPVRRVVGRAISLFAAAAAGFVGYRFGRDLDGVLLGAVTGANMAVLGALLTDAASDWIARRLGTEKPRA